MKSFNATWQASDWGEDIADCITVYLPGEMEHDYEIRTVEDLEKIPDAPEELREFVRSQLPKPCPTCKGEGKVWEDNCGPNVWREDCPKCQQELAPDQVRFDDGTVGRMRLNGKFTRIDTSDRYILVTRPDTNDDGYWTWSAIRTGVTDEAQRQRVRDFARKNRPLADDETWNWNRTKRGVMSVDGEWLRIQWQDGQRSKHRRKELNDTHPEWVRRMNFYDRHAPKLAENEVRVGGMLLQMRWHEGKPEVRWPNGDPSDWYQFHSKVSHNGDQAKMIAWFRANCPIDRFVTDDGRVLEFRMRDDGEAECLCADGKRFGDPTQSEMGEGLIGYTREALYRFRDHERGKWKFDYAPKANHVGASIGGLWAGYWNANGWTPLNCYKSPTWVRNQAEALYREKNPEWRVEWWSENNAGPAAAIYKGDEYWGKLSALGFKWKCEISHPPEHILTQARAKFRENYQLRRDEIWFQGMPVKMVFVKKTATECSRVIVQTKVREPGCIPVHLVWVEEAVPKDNWGKGFAFADNTERLEAYDRMRRFYYEELQLQRLTDDRLKREVEKVVFEGKVVESNYLWTRENGDKIQSAELLCTDGSKMLLQEVKLSNSVLRDTCLNGGFLRVTVEALGDG